MKPLLEKTFLDQALQNGKGITWLDACRIPVSGESVPRLNKPYLRKNGESFGGAQDKRLGTLTGHAGRGRFPANLLVSDKVLDGDEIRKRDAVEPMAGKRGVKSVGGVDDASRGYSSGESFSRFFDLDAWTATLPFLIVPKPSKREKNKGLENFVAVRRADRKKVDGLGGHNPRNRTNTPKPNHHPTVKPVKLMAYLIMLGSRPGDVVLDPFLGSGTTAVAAELLGRRFIGIEQDKEYVAIARARLAAAQAPA